MLTFQRYPCPDPHPTRGIFVPSHILYHPWLTAAEVHTWIMLRGLAWGKTYTPPMNSHELESITHKSEATMYRHTTQLRLFGALQWRSAGPGKVIFMFPEEPTNAKLDHSKLPTGGQRRSDDRARYADYVTPVDEEFDERLPELKELEVVSEDEDDEHPDEGNFENEAATPSKTVGCPQKMFALGKSTLGESPLGFTRPRCSHRPEESVEICSTSKMRVTSKMRTASKMRLIFLKNAIL